jgi:hypothetical protein
MEAETLLALGDALAAQGHEDAAGDAWQQAGLIFSAFLLPESDKIQSRLMRGRTPAAPDRG